MELWRRLTLLALVAVVTVMAAVGIVSTFSVAIGVLVGFVVLMGVLMLGEDWLTARDLRVSRGAYDRGVEHGRAVEAERPELVGR